MTHPILLIKPLLSLDSLQKVGFLARWAGGAVEKNGRLVSAATTYLCSNRRWQVNDWWATVRKVVKLKTGNELLGMEFLVYSTKAHLVNWRIIQTTFKPRKNEPSVILPNDNKFIIWSQRSLYSSVLHYLKLYGIKCPTRCVVCIFFCVKHK